MLQNYKSRTFGTLPPYGLRVKNPPRQNTAKPAVPDLRNEPHTLIVLKDFRMIGPDVFCMFSEHITIQD